jgi:hypothetical protein
VMRIASAAGVLVTFAAALTACSGSGLGTVTGVAAPCGGPPAPSGLPGWVLAPIRVRAMANGRTVASVVVSYRKDRDRYRLSLRPGPYAIVSLGDPQGKVVTVQADRRITANLPDLCS